MPEKKIGEPATGNSRKRAVLCVMACLFGVVLLAYGEMFGEMTRAMRHKDGLYIPIAQQQGQLEAGGTERQVVGTFHLFNLSNRPLQIKAEADCSCSSLSWSEHTLGPWQHEILSAHMKIRPSSSRVSSNIALLISANTELQQPVRNLALRGPER